MFTILVWIAVSMLSFQAAQHLSRHSTRGPAQLAEPLPCPLPRSGAPVPQPGGGRARGETAGGAAFAAAGVVRRGHGAGPQPIPGPDGASTASHSEGDGRQDRAVHPHGRHPGVQTPDHTDKDLALYPRYHAPAIRGCCHRALQPRTCKWRSGTPDHSKGECKTPFISVHFVDSSLQGLLWTFSAGGNS